MKKIKFKIILGIALTAIALLVIITGPIIYISAKSINQEAAEKLSYLASCRKNEIQTLTTKIENVVDNMAEYILVDLDSSKAKDDEYMEDFIERNSHVFLNIGQSNDDIIGLYFNMDPSYTSGNRGFDIAYIHYTDTKEDEMDLKVMV